MIDDSHWFRNGLIGTLLLAGLLLGAEFVLGGVPGVEKLATAMMLPLGLFWLGALLLTIGLWSIRLDGAAAFATLLLLGLTVAGNGYVAAALMEDLEGPYSLTAQMTDQPDEADTEADNTDAPPKSNGPTYDLLVLLGGGVWERPDGSPQGNRAGDRLMQVARLYHAGRVREIRCTGAMREDISPLKEPEAELSRRLLVELAVPREAISLGVGGNTSEEIADLAKAERERSDDDDRTIGIVTSAWHMSRVVRLAKAADLDIVPVPADFRSVRRASPGGSVMTLVPHAAALEQTSICLREHLAKLVSR